MSKSRPCSSWIPMDAGMSSSSSSNRTNLAGRCTPERSLSASCMRLFCGNWSQAHHACLPYQPRLGSHMSAIAAATALSSGVASPADVEKQRAYSACSCSVCQRQTSSSPMRTMALDSVTVRDAFVSSSSSSSPSSPSPSSNMFPASELKSGSESRLETNAHSAAAVSSRHSVKPVASSTSARLRLRFTAAFLWLDCVVNGDGGRAKMAAVVAARFLDAIGERILAREARTAVAVDSEDEECLDGVERWCGASEAVADCAVYVVALPRFFRPISFFRSTIHFPSVYSLFSRETRGIKEQGDTGIDGCRFVCAYR
ncbi:hypothetical protein BC830DRAFT_934188 [Chytriomyces sp. MP71]|nr:hypothetical protein BC830DRAFT_934188 [Chytriomyces sp. MP71]